MIFTDNEVALGMAVSSAASRRRFLDKSWWSAYVDLKGPSMNSIGISMSIQLATLLKFHPETLHCAVDLVSCSDVI